MALLHATTISAEHECLFEALEVPGQTVTPVVISPCLLLKCPTMAPLLLEHPCMRPLGMYRCRVCGVYVYVTAQLQVVHLIEVVSGVGEAPG